VLPTHLSDDHCGFCGLQAIIEAIVIGYTARIFCLPAGFLYRIHRLGAAAIAKDRNALIEQSVFIIMG